MPCCNCYCSSCVASLLNDNHAIPFQKLLKIKRNDNTNKSDLVFLDKDGVSRTFTYICDFDNTHLLFRNDYERKLYIPKSNTEILEFEVV